MLIAKNMKETLKKKAVTLEKNIGCAVARHQKNCDENWKDLYCFFPMAEPLKRWKTAFNHTKSEDERDGMEMEQRKFLLLKWWILFSDVNWRQKMKAFLAGQSYLTKVDVGAIASFSKCHETELNFFWELFCAVWVSEINCFVMTLMMMMKWLSRSLRINCKIIVFTFYRDVSFALAFLFA